MMVSRMLRLVGWLSLTVTVMVCAAQSPPPKFAVPAAPSQVDTGAAKVIVLDGDVSVLRTYPWALQIGDAVQMQEVIITGPDGYALFELSDGSQFEIFPDSRVSFRNNPGNWRDLLDLWLGRVKVYIQKMGGQPNPHRIFTPTAVISVRGTVFDVVLEDVADTTLVSVDEGVVSVRHRLIGESRDTLVSAGEYLRIYKDAPLAKSFIDKGTIFQRVFRAASDALYTILINNRGGGGIPTGGGSPGPIPGGGPTLPGDTGGGPPSTPGDPAPPTGPPPPPSSPPPPPGN